MNTTDDVLIYVIQRECLGCHPMFPQVHSVVEFFGGQPNLRFGSIDNRVNDVFIRPWAEVQTRWSADGTLCWNTVCARGDIPLD